MKITGVTSIYGIIADPIVHVKTPQIINKIFDEAGSDGILIPLHVSDCGLEDVVNGFRRMRNLKGFVVTVPFKERMLKLCDDLTDEARQVGAVNCVSRKSTGELLGTTLDGVGFVKGLWSEGICVKGKRICLLGAGGAAASIAFSLAEHGALSLTILNRTKAKAEQLCQRIRDFYPSIDINADCHNLDGMDLIVNASTLGMRPDDPLPIDPSYLTERNTVVEIIMQPKRTKFLDVAISKGCKVQYGLPMLQQQSRLMIDFMSAEDRSRNVIF